MKKLVLMAAVAALAACSQQAEDDAATTETAEAEATAAAPAGTQPGTYEVTMADGTKGGKTVINADGTYIDTGKDGKQEKGTFVHKGGKDCFDPEGDKPEECWTVSTPGADGAFTATGPDGKTTVTVKPASAAAGTPTPAAT